MKRGQEEDSRRNPGAAATKEQPLDRALALMTALSRATRPLSLTEIATQCGLPVPTAHRLTAQLEERGLLKRGIASKKLVVGPAMVRLSIASLEAAFRSDIPHQILVEFANEIGEHCQVGLRSEDGIVYVDTAQATRSLALHFELGRRSPLHCSSIGKLYLAEMPLPDLDRWLANATLTSVTPHTIVSASKLKAVIKNVRKEGWAASNEEIAVGVAGCAVPIRDSEGRLVAGLGISVPSARVPFERLSEYRQGMESVAERIAAALTANNDPVREKSSTKINGSIRRHDQTRRRQSGQTRQS